MNDRYQQDILQDLRTWQAQMQQGPSLTNRMTAAIQSKLNNLYPQKLMNAVTVAIKGMTRAVLFGSTYTTSKPLLKGSLCEREMGSRQSN